MLLSSAKNVDHYAQYYALNYFNYGTVQLQIYYFNEYISVAPILELVALTSKIK